ncbi:putative permease [Lachnospiraceae bacterium JC7]|nr:putative permease [Lachnospiraceae bacterium JC7]
MVEKLFFFAISLFASTVGAICGIGGGVIIKPVLDMFSSDSVSTISFMSGCTVLAMSLYSVGKSMAAGEKTVELKSVTPLALGAAIGGIAGKLLFDVVKKSSGNPDGVGTVQSVCLAIMTIMTLVYTLNKSKIKTYRIDNAAISVIVGLTLGIMSSFLGIGGGPINLVILYFFFSMATKQAAANSLYIILFSQITSFLFTIFTGTVPVFSPLSLGLMVAGGVLGGMLGRKVNKKINNETVEKLFAGLMVLIIGISIFNSLRYSGMI